MLITKKLSKDISIFIFIVFCSFLWQWIKDKQFPLSKIAIVQITANSLFFFLAICTAFIFVMVVTIIFLVAIKIVTPQTNEIIDGLNLKALSIALFKRLLFLLPFYLSLFILIVYYYKYL